MASHILIIDGDISLSTVLNDYFETRGYRSQVVHTGKAGLAELGREPYDLVLMDLQGIGMNGYELMKEIRQHLPLIPLIILTARTDREDQLRAFQLGADDYQFKPFTIDILICRMEAVLKRTRARENKQRVFSLNGHTFDSVHNTFDDAHLSARMSDILLMLCREEGNIVDKRHILIALWKEDNVFNARSLGVFVHHLRHFLTPAGYAIIPVRNRGYKLVNNRL